VCAFTAWKEHILVFELFFGSMPCSSLSGPTQVSAQVPLEHGSNPPISMLKCVQLFRHPPFHIYDLL
jgi:hypothetical protein